MISLKNECLRNKSLRNVFFALFFILLVLAPPPGLLGGFGLGGFFSLRFCAIMCPLLFISVLRKAFLWLFLTVLSLTVSCLRLGEPAAVRGHFVVALDDCRDVLVV